MARLWEDEDRVATGSTLDVKNAEKSSDHPTSARSLRHVHLVGLAVDACQFLAVSWATTPPVSRVS